MSSTSMMKCWVLLSLLTQVICDKLVPSSPEIFYGGFVPMIVKSESDSTESSEVLPEERRSRHLSLIEDETEENNIISRVYRFKEGDEKNQLKKTFLSQNIIPFHKGNKPKFPKGTYHLQFNCSYLNKVYSLLEIPKKNKFTAKDAIVGELPVIEEDSVKSEQFQIFNFLSNVRLPKFPDILGNMIKRPPSLPPNPVIQKPQPPRPQFFPSPQNSLNNPNHKIPDHQHPSSHSPAANEALTVFNQGLDNFIQNPASLAHVSRPGNG